MKRLKRVSVVGLSACLIALAACSKKSALDALPPVENAPVEGGEVTSPESTVPSSEPDLSRLNDQTDVQDPYVPPGTIMEEDIPSDLNSANNPLAEETPPPVPATVPIDLGPVPPTYTATPAPTAIPVAGNELLGSLKVDQDLLNQWRAIGMAYQGGYLYVTVVDEKGLSKKGTVVKIDSATGKTWKDLGKAWFGLSYTMSGAINGVASDPSGNLFITEAGTNLYTLTAPDYKSVVKAAGPGSATDVAFNQGNLYFASGGQLLKATSSSPTSGSAIGGSLSVSGGIGTDKDGNILAVCGSSIKRIKADGTVETPVNNLSNAIDVVGDQQGLIYVLFMNEVRRFTASGEDRGSFGIEVLDGTSIAVDGSNAVFVADRGSSEKDSMVHKFSPAQL